MTRTLYVLAWFFLIAATMVLGFKGTLNEFTMVILGLVGLGLIYGLALWSAIVNTGYAQPE